MKIVSVVGTRPNLVKEYAMHRHFKKRGIAEILVHSGQHYDYEMSEVFFDQLGIPRPKYVNTMLKGSHAQETSTIMTYMEAVLMQERPTATLIYGDVNSTLAAAVASAKLRIPVIHVEAGVRSEMRYNPEEINRRVADAISDLLFPNTREAYDHLMREGYPEDRVFQVGDIMLDALLTASREHDIPTNSGDYHMLTVHRAENTDDPARLRMIVDAAVALGEKICFPVHPRTEKQLRDFGLMEKLETCNRIELLPPLGFLEFLRLLAGCNKVITDSGGVRREGYMLGKPVITLIGIIWFPEIVKSGWTRVIDKLESPEQIAAAIRTHAPTGPRPPVFGDGTAAAKIVDVIADRYS